MQRCEDFYSGVQNLWNRKIKPNKYNVKHFSFVCVCVCVQSLCSYKMQN